MLPLHNLNILVHHYQIFPEFHGDTRDMQFQKTFITPLNFILEAIGWDYEKKASLEAFFG